MKKFFNNIIVNRTRASQISIDIVVHESESAALLVVMVQI